MTTPSGTGDTPTGPDLTAGLDAAGGTYEYPAEVVHRRAAETAALHQENARLRDHLDRDHGVMVQLGIIADSAVKILEHVNMDTAEDRELHARAVGALRGRLSELAAEMKEADDAADWPDRGAAENGP
jgi:hypothetical protein